MPRLGRWGAFAGGFRSRNLRYGDLDYRTGARGTMTIDGDEGRSAHTRPAHTRPAPAEQRPAVGTTGSVICVFDGAPVALAQLRLAAQAAMASNRPLVVAHVQKWGTRFWATAFIGHGACLGPAEPLLGAIVETTFAAAVLTLVDLDLEWDFEISHRGGYRGLRRLVDSHGPGVLVMGRQRIRGRLLLRRLGRVESLTVLAY